MTTEHGTHQAALTEDFDHRPDTEPTAAPSTEPTTATGNGAASDTVTDNGAEPHADLGGHQAKATRSGSDSARQSEVLIAPDLASGYKDRWNELKGDFVDDPRHTVRRIDGLVGEVLDELEQVFRRQRGELESGMADESASTEDLRVAFGRYREFFDRLLAF
ncbi:MAG TPA: hypothetical protein VH141_25590 [Pseudonocardia sp.]|jgi:hypothetical protein|nr:hypothetical protein [Pseudonocardia sp.]